MSFESPDRWRDEDGWVIVSLARQDELHTKLAAREDTINNLRQELLLRDSHITRLNARIETLHLLEHSEGAVSGPLIRLAS